MDIVGDAEEKCTLGFWSERFYMCAEDLLNSFSLFFVEATSANWLVFCQMSVWEKKLSAGCAFYTCAFCTEFM